MSSISPHTLVNPATGNLSLKIFPFFDNSHFDHLQRVHYYSIIWIRKGKSKLNADFSEYALDEDSLLFFSPYQPFMITAPRLQGIAIHFHSDFYCIHKHNHEVACNGVLFNNIYQSPFLQVANGQIPQLETIVQQMCYEMQEEKLAQNESLISYLKLFLIAASRIKVEQHPEARSNEMPGEEHCTIQHLKDAIEHNFRTKHAPGDYAELLHISQKALAKLAKNYFNKTLTDLIAERIVIEAKRELYLTSRPIKAIASELGFDDEYYFSRFFKNNVNISPQRYRQTVGYGKGEVLTT